jgi:hypothetical protein
MSIFGHDTFVVAVQYLQIKVTLSFKLLGWGSIGLYLTREHSEDELGTVHSMEMARAAASRIDEIVSRTNMGENFEIDWLSLIRVVDEYEREQCSQILEKCAYALHLPEGVFDVRPLNDFEIDVLANRFFNVIYQDDGRGSIEVELTPVAVFIGGRKLGCDEAEASMFYRAMDLFFNNIRYVTYDSLRYQLSISGMADENDSRLYVTLTPEDEMYDGAP